jgi:hypothetical protein
MWLLQFRESLVKEIGKIQKIMAILIVPTNLTIAMPTNLRQVCSKILHTGAMIIDQEAQHQKTQIKHTLNQNQLFLSNS